ncbi:MAG: hypothetical protein EXS28_05935 [Pedosphaera sp.]|nr:hypothetical protein [Pedosphaera sp.]
MSFLLQHSELNDLHDKVAAGVRLSDDDALRLFESKDLNAWVRWWISPARARWCRRRMGSQ